MIKTVTLTVLPEHVADDAILLEQLKKQTGISDIVSFRLLRKSLDARKKPIRFQIQADLYVAEVAPSQPFDFQFKQVHHAPHAVIIGAGPAGLFAALKLIENGIKPIVFERGKDVKSRRRDLAQITRFLAVNPESNYCFGEGGAGTYSDGKLYTRSTKRGDVKRILQLFVMHGADSSILYEAHPHIGTNKLPGIITNIRQTIIEYGGEVHFQSKLTDIHIESGAIKSVVINEKQSVQTQQLILATGHSARDIFELLYKKNIAIEAKPFALGVRIEHPQALIDSIQYKCDARGPYLPPASYSIVNQSLGRGVFSFCMCPGGIIAPAATSPGEVVVNGWSPSKRNNEFANSGLVVSIESKDFQQYQQHGPLAAMYFQRMVEQQCFAATQSIKAPAQRVLDFIQNKHSTVLPNCSYLPGIESHQLSDVLPLFVVSSLRDALKVFEKKLRGYVSNEAVMVATESRTSSPVRIPRNRETLEHIEVAGLYPCAEGAGYAGGIVSAAMDGERCADMIAKKVKNV